MAVKKTTKKVTAKKTGAAVKKTKPAARKTAATKTVAKKAVKPVKKAKAPARKSAPKKAKAATRKVAPKVSKASRKKTTTQSTATASKTTSKTTSATSDAAADIFAASIPAFKEMEKLMTANQSFQFDQMAQEAANQSREGIEAFVKSSTIFAKGMEELVQAAASLSQNAAEKQAEFAKQLMSSQTPNEFAEAQSKIAQANFDQLVANATKLSEMSAKVLTEASEPINAHVTKAVQKANQTMAA